MRQTNFFYLLIALLLVLIVIPLADDLAIGNARVVRAVTLSALLLIGIWSLRGGGRYFTSGMAFVVAGVLLNVIAANTHSAVFHFSSIAALIGFLAIAIAYTLRQVVIGTEISLNRLVGAICVYLLLGVIWALFYTLTDLVQPDSFAGFAPGDDLGWASEWLYFSFVTMTTLGYGDILPVSATARGLAYLQAMVGQFYIAILVAGLVSAYIGNRQS